MKQQIFTIHCDSHGQWAEWVLEWVNNHLLVIEHVQDYTTFVLVLFHKTGGGESGALIWGDMLTVYIKFWLIRGALIQREHLFTNVSRRAKFEDLRDSIVCQVCPGQLGSTCSTNRAYYNKVGYRTDTGHDNVHLTYSTRNLFKSVIHRYVAIPYTNQSLVIHTDLWHSWLSGHACLHTVNTNISYLIVTKNFNSTSGFFSLNKGKFGLCITSPKYMTDVCHWIVTER